MWLMFWLLESESCEIFRSILNFGSQETQCFENFYHSVSSLYPVLIDQNIQSQVLMSKNLRTPHQILILILSESTRITKLLLTPKINRKT